MNWGISYYPRRFITYSDYLIYSWPARSWVGAYVHTKCMYTHLPLTENRLKFFVPSNPTNNYENIYIWWHEIIKINLVSQALFEKTHFSVILYYKIDHFCPLKINFHTFPAIWPNVWVWNSLLPSFYHLLVQLRHARSLFFPLGTNDCAKIKPRCKKYAVGFWKSRFILGQKSVFNHSYRCQEGNKKLLVYLTCTNKW